MHFHVAHSDRACVGIGRAQLPNSLGTGESQKLLRIPASCRIMDPDLEYLSSYRWGSPAPTRLV